MLLLTNTLGTPRFLRGANAYSASNPNPQNKTRDLISLAVLIDHPEAGLLLFETGCAEDLDVVCFPSMSVINYIRH